MGQTPPVCLAADVEAFVLAEEALKSLVGAERGYNAERKVLVAAKSAAHHILQVNKITEDIKVIESKLASIQLRKIAEQKVMHQVVSKVGAWVCIRDAIGRHALKLVPGVLLIDAFLSMQGTAQAEEKGIDITWISSDQCNDLSKGIKEIQNKMDDLNVLIARNRDTRRERSLETYSELEQRYKVELDGLSRQAIDANYQLQSCIEMASRNLADQIKRDNVDCDATLRKRRKDYDLNIKCKDNTVYKLEVK